jgi:DNA-binding response OmpR family regulator
MAGSPELVSENTPTTSKTILLVEDDIDLSSCLVAALKEATAYHVILASNGAEALKTASVLKPDLFLLDYHLPSMDGLELYEHLHTMKGLENVPTLFLTAYPFSLAIRGRKVISLKKPFDFNELLRIIHELCK